MKSGIVAFAIVGFGVSLIVHISSIFGIDLSEDYPAVWGLHVAAILIMFPAIFSVRKKSNTKSAKGIFQGTPKYLFILSVVCFVYAFLNFFLIFTLNFAAGNATDVDATTMRAFSGHWMLFYAVAMAMMIKKPVDEQEQYQ